MNDTDKIREFLKETWCLFKSYNNKVDLDSFRDVLEALDIPAQDEESLKQVFEAIDEDGDGYIQYKELAKNVINNFNYEGRIEDLFDPDRDDETFLTLEQVKGLQKIFDQVKGKNDRADLSEFSKRLESISLTNFDFEKIFEPYWNRGYINKDEFYEVIEPYEKNLFNYAGDKYVSSLVKSETDFKMDEEESIANDTFVYHGNTQTTVTNSSTHRNIYTSEDAEGSDVDLIDMLDDFITRRRWKDRNDDGVSHLLVAIKKCAETVVGAYHKSRTSLKDTTDKYENLKSEQESIKKMLEEYKKENYELMEYQKSLEEDMDQLFKIEGEYKEVLASRDKLEEDFSNSEYKNRELERRILSLEKENSTLKEDLSYLKNENKEMQGALRDYRYAVRFPASSSDTPQEKSRRTTYANGEEIEINDEEEDHTVMGMNKEAQEVFNKDISERMNVVESLEIEKGKLQNNHDKELIETLEKALKDSEAQLIYLSQQNDELKDKLNSIEQEYDKKLGINDMLIKTLREEKAAISRDYESLRLNRFSIANRELHSKLKQDVIYSQNPQRESLFIRPSAILKSQIMQKNDIQKNAIQIQNVTFEKAIDGSDLEIKGNPEQPIMKGPFIYEESKHSNNDASSNFEKLSIPIQNTPTRLSEWAGGFEVAEEFDSEMKSPEKKEVGNDQSPIRASLANVLSNMVKQFSEIHFARASPVKSTGSISRVSNIKTFDFIGLRKRTNELFEKVSQVLEKCNDSTFVTNVFSDYADRINSKDERKAIILLATEKYIYILAKNGKYIHHLPVDSLSEVTLIRKNANVIVLHFKKEKADRLIQSFRRLELVLYLMNVVTMRKLPVFKVRYANGLKVQTQTEQKTIKFDSQDMDPKELTIANKFIDRNFDNAIHIGYLKKQSNSKFFKKWSKKFCVLTNIGLIYYEDISKPPKDLIHIVDSEIIVVNNPADASVAYGFRIKTWRTNELFAAESAEERDAWVSKMKRIQDESLKRQKEKEELLQKRLSSQRDA